MLHRDLGGVDLGFGDDDPAHAAHPLAGPVHGDGLMASLTGIFWALHYASARYDNATGLELSVVAAVLLGGIDFDLHSPAA